MTTNIPISLGEVLDRLSILNIKKDRFVDSKKLEFVTHEIKTLPPVESQYKDLFNQLLDVNKTLWNVEDRLRELEIFKKFDEEFTFLARSVYKLNDRRFELKNKINTLSEMKIAEQKQHPMVIKKQEIIIFPHLGIGDFLCCLSAIRIYAEQFKIHLIIKAEYEDKIKFFLKDITDIEYILVHNDRYQDLVFDKGIPVIGIGQHRTGQHIRVRDFPGVFYSDFNLPKSEMFSSFFYIRDMFEENRVYESIIKDHPEYVVIHDDPTRGLFVDEQKIPNDVYRVYLGREHKDIPMIYSKKLLEHAKEIHCIDSSFLWFVGMNRIDTKKVLHSAARKNLKDDPIVYFGEAEGNTWNVV
ncbi:hypothetical protein BST79_gp024 [Only Syngen Nebraska virus 5]|uniref:hypothetical protein n=1 Tax=Only Syngen Nebraska virus 5 TaxID=1917232 RepID=UPI000900CDB0|nr:hypothetical protein BST79_gp024 [Only Syngen Nebraska virus 5]APC25537.1 hypothetical protein [Only Syngen Nebraska virus 5]